MYFVAKFLCSNKLTPVVRPELKKSSRNFVTFTIFTNASSAHLNWDAAYIYIYIAF